MAHTLCHNRPRGGIWGEGAAGRSSGLCAVGGGVGWLELLTRTVRHLTPASQPTTGGLCEWCDAENTLLDVVGLMMVAVYSMSTSRVTCDFGSDELFDCLVEALTLEIFLFTTK